MKKKKRKKKYRGALFLNAQSKERYFPFELKALNVKLKIRTRENVINKMIPEIDYSYTPWNLPGVVQCKIYF